MQVACRGRFRPAGPPHPPVARRIEPGLLRGRIEPGHLCLRRHRRRLPHRLLRCNRQASANSSVRKHCTSQESRRATLRVHADCPVRHHRI